MKFDNLRYVSTGSFFRWRSCSNLFCDKKIYFSNSEDIFENVCVVGIVRVCAGHIRADEKELIWEIVRGNNKEDITFFRGVLDRVIVERDGLDDNWITG